MSKKSYEIINDNRKELVQKIIDNMKNGYVMPRDDWSSLNIRPYNPVSNVKYRGGNMLRLAITSAMNEYSDPRWMTFKQATEAGYKISKGAHGIKCEKWIFDKEVKQVNPITGQEEKVKIQLDKPKVNYFTVFNGTQIEGLPQIELTKLEKNEVLEIAETFIKSSECPIIEKNQDRAFYSPLRDEITLPPRNLFRDQEAFLATTLHEMVHSTGHEKRLNRSLINKFNSESYAMEELRAELGAYFTEIDLGISLGEEQFNSHTNYLESWIRALENDPNELFRACSDAEAATNRLIKNYEQYKQQENSVTKDIEKITENIAMDEIVLEQPLDADLVMEM